ncbi:PqqD family protein [Salinadaptatus halalkaliphilus]|uniref:PqqD family protein n=1 Tax=Salinadaptatus halalkaliphilus TaxID=2419781 RepID=A0A4S3TM41_9EURY|nr:PqqD family peptide modification chaperone [Salinadaptatus halalkaliphilus]THE65156.1 PqqD family protein [Salinadaptatus halalkaliphilus]
MSERGEGWISASTTVVATDDQLSTTIDGEAVTLQVESGTYYGFNEVASRIWELLQEPRTVGEITETILAEYDVSPDQCRQDVESTVAEMATADLVETDPDTQGGD